MKTRIIICVSNRPDLLEKQIQLLNNFMIGEKVVSIVYDTRDKQYESFFKKICDDYNLEYHLHLSEPIVHQVFIMHRQQHGHIRM